MLSGSSTRCSVRSFMPYPSVTGLSCAGSVHFRSGSTRPRPDATHAQAMPSRSPPSEHRILRPARICVTSSTIAQPIRPRTVRQPRPQDALSTYFLRSARTQLTALMGVIRHAPDQAQDLLADLDEFQARLDRPDVSVALLAGERHRQLFKNATRARRHHHDLGP